MNRSFLRGLVELVALLAVVLIGMQFLMHHVISKDVVRGTSMQPSLQSGDRLYSIRNKAVKRHAIVVVHAPDKPGELYIKRVIGMPGDTLKVVAGKLYVNDHYQKEPYLSASFKHHAVRTYAARLGVAQGSIQYTTDFNIQTLASTQAKHVPAGQYFVMGDNRLVSHDSRDFGFVSQAQIQSVVLWRYWPLTQWQWY